MVRLQLPIATVILPLLLTLAYPVGATVTLLKQGSALPAWRYPSRPALFGNKFDFGLEYVARLQVLRYDDGRGGEFEDIYLCGDQGGGSMRREYDSNKKYGHEDDDAIFSGGEGGGEGRRSAAAEEKLRDGNGKIVVPTEGTPVALLARRGMCSYETKARTASSVLPSSNTLRYVIVYDDRPDHKLVDMLPDDWMDDADLQGDGSLRPPRIRHVEIDGVTVGLVFVSLGSGQDLYQHLRDQSNDSKLKGGPRILLDGYADSVFPSGAASSPWTWIVIILLMLAGFSCCSCLFTINSLQAEQAQAQNATVQRRRREVVLLTEEEVRTLPEVAYRADRKRRGGYLPPPELGGTECADSKSGGIEMSEQSVHNASSDPPLRPDNDDDRGGGDVEDLGQQPLLQQSDGSNEEEDYLEDGCCTICIEEYEEGDRLRILPCRHAFHSECIMPWLTERSPTCPLCKAEFEAVGGEEEEEGASEGGSSAHEDPLAGARDIFGLNLEVSDSGPDGERTIEFSSAEEATSAEGSGSDDGRVMGRRDPASTGFFRSLFRSPSSGSGGGGHLLSGRLGAIFSGRSISVERGDAEEPQGDLEEPLLAEDEEAAEEEGRVLTTEDEEDILVERRVVEEEISINAVQEGTGDESQHPSEDTTTASV